MRVAMEAVWALEVETSVALVTCVVVIRVKEYNHGDVSRC